MDVICAIFRVRELGRARTRKCVLRRLFQRVTSNCIVRSEFLSASQSHEMTAFPKMSSQPASQPGPAGRGEGGTFINPGVCRTDSIITAEKEGREGDGDHRHHRRMTDLQTDGRSRHSPDSRKKKNHKKVPGRAEIERCCDPIA